MRGRPAAKPTPAGSHSARPPPPPPRSGDSGVVARQGVSLDRRALIEQGFLPEGRELELADEYRLIKRPLIDNAFGDANAEVAARNMVMITSAEAGEGKSFTALNLALSLALEKDLGVVLIDADSAKRRLSSAFGLSDKPGFTDFVADEGLSFEDVSYATDPEGLVFVPAGQQPPHGVTELLSSRRMERLIEELSLQRSHCMFVFDAPPLLATSDAVVLADLVGQIVFVVKANATLRSSVESALQLLSDEKIVNCVLNQAVYKTHPTYYGSEPLALPETLPTAPGKELVIFER